MNSTLSNEPYMQYANDVLSGKISTNILVQMACERFLKDLESNRWQFRPELVERVTKFSQLLPVIEGPLAGNKIKLMNWQHFAIANLFGFTDEHGTRRFRQGTIFVPRGNAKSATASLLGLYMLCADGEARPQVYSAATKTDQAKIVWSAAQQIVRDTRSLSVKYGLKSTNNNSSHTIRTPDGGIFAPLSSEAKGLLGLNTHFAVLDEIASHPSPAVYEAIQTSLAKRRHPMMLNISTATGDNDGIGKSLWEDGVKVLSLEAEEERHFFLLYSIDEEDDPYDPVNWSKANPSWGITVMPDAFEATMRQARQNPAREAAAFTLHLNKWIQTDNALFSVNTMRRCADPNLKIDDFAGQPCHIGLDLAYKLDLCGLAITFPKYINGKLNYYTFTLAYLNEEAIRKISNQRYPGWVRRGLIDVTEGNTTDFDRIIDDIIKLSKRFVIKSICIDRMYAAGVMHLLMKEDLPVIEYPMTVLHLTAPTREFEAAMADGRFHYDGNPVLEWNVGNVIGHYDSNNNVHPKKNPKKQHEKVDLALATIMSIAKCMGEQDEGSVYNQRGILIW